MKPLPEVFLEFAALYQEHGFSLYMIGGTSRDYLLDLPCADLDFVTDATPKEQRLFVENANYTFARFGSVRIPMSSGHIDVTTLRKEWGYEDHRHPSHIAFIKDLREDSLRRDFTVNALYIDAHGTVHDYHHGLEDLDAKILRFIGDPHQRILEDPLRIIRAERFARRLGFVIEDESLRAMEELKGELDKLNPEKVLMEKKKD